MKKQYVMSESDFALLRRRKPNPCVSERCSRGAPSFDPGYMGCGCEAHCDRRHEYKIFWEQAKAAGLEDVAQRLCQIDAIRAKVSKLNTEIAGVLCGIQREYGIAISSDIVGKLYDGRI